MADLKFPCPSCQQSIICDELWCGQKIQCPSCNAELVVPAQQSTEAPSLVPKPPSSGASKLSIGRQAAPAQGAPPSQQRSIPGVKPPAVRPKKKSPILKYAMVVVLLAAIGAAGYFGYDWWNKRQAKAEADAAAAKAAAAAAETASQKTTATEKPLPVLPPTWSLDIASAKIPEGQANGSLGGTNFVVETAVLNKIGTAQVLALRPAGTSIDRDLMIYLHLAAGEVLPGHNWTISQDMKGATVPQILKRWKPTPNGALQQKFFSTGYAMKLEVGQAATDGAIPGKIFLSLPDPEQSVVAGMFKITTPAAPDAAATAAQNAAAAQAPAAAGAPTPNRAAFDKRYGVKRP